MNFKTFICYRGTIDHDYSLNMAKSIYELIKDDDRFAPVFFDRDQADYDFMKSEGMIKTCDRIIVCLSNSFFDDFESGNKIDFDHLARENAAYVELLNGFKHGVSFVPVYNSIHFKMIKIKPVLKEIYGSQGYDINRFVHRTGVGVDGNEFPADRVSHLLSVREKNTDQEETFKSHLLYISESVSGNIIWPRQKEIIEKCNSKSYINRAIHLLFEKNYNEMLEKCGLKQEKYFNTWDVDMDDYDPDAEDLSISVCATCFGALLLNNWIQQDCQLTGHVPQEIDQTKLKGHVNSAIQLLLYLRDPVDGTWMASWDNNKFTSGTINQTTLSLSTLLSTGFLTNAIREYNEAVPRLKAQKRTQLFNRYEVIKESIDWLISSNVMISKKSPTYGRYYCWSSMPGNNEDKMLPTLFCFDVFCKLEKDIAAMLSLEISETNKKTLKQDLDRVKAAIDRTLAYFYKVSGDIPAKKYVNAALLSRSLTPYIFNHSDSVSNAAIAVNEICMNLLKELSMDEVWYKEEDRECYFEHFEYEPRSKMAHKDFPYEINPGEEYEICAELILADALIKNAYYYRQNGQKNLEEKCFTNIDSILKGYSERYITIHHGNLKIRGKRDCYPEYPIYVLYYYRMVLYDYLTYPDLEH
ncbi:MAG: hypothetical protein PUB22_00005 [Clostridiales bacterium]|nr:hypothetical protein [Clostridiales bacterium]